MDRSFGHSVFSKPKNVLLEADVTRKLLRTIEEQAREQRLLSEGHFGVGGTLMETWA